MTTRNSHSDTLFHYTKKLSTLYSILGNGLKVSYSGEQITDEIFIGIPMISFCDIPIELCEEHRQKYGNYAIGVNKSRLIEAAGEHLSPVHYIIDDWPILGAYRHHREYLRAEQRINVFMQRKRSAGAEEISITGPDGSVYKGFSGFIGTEDNDVLKDINHLFNAKNYANYALGITKNYNCTHNGTVFCAYDECEWRIVIPENQEIKGKLAPWFWSKDEFLTWRKLNGSSFLDGFVLEFANDDIDYLVVPNVLDKQRLEKRLMAIGREALICKICVCNGR